MGKKKCLGIFSKDWVIWAHYIPLALLGAIVVFVLPISKLFNESQPSNTVIFSYAALFIILYFVFAISDQITHAIIGRD